MKTGNMSVVIKGRCFSMIKRHKIEIDSVLANVKIDTSRKTLASRLELACEHVLKEFEEKELKNKKNGD